MVEVLHLVIVDAGGLVGAVEALVNAVGMDPPDVIDALVNVAVVVILAGHGWGKQPEEHVLSLQLEDGYIKIINISDS
jgi:hypothetical protein